MSNGHAVVEKNVGLMALLIVIVISFGAWRKSCRCSS